MQTLVHLVIATNRRLVSRRNRLQDRERNCVPDAFELTECETVVLTVLPIVLVLGIAALVASAVGLL